MESKILQVSFRVGLSSGNTLTETVGVEIIQGKNTTIRAFKAIIERIESKEGSYKDLSSITLAETNHLKTFDFSRKNTGKKKPPKIQNKMKEDLTHGRDTKCI